jgi:AcrR family transcriptional regulator
MCDSAGVDYGLPLPAGEQPACSIVIMRCGRRIRPDARLRHPDFANAMESHLTDITRVIQLAVAPVFLLTAIATMINALNTRLGRIVDRRRVVQERLHSRSDDEAEAGRQEIRMLVRRARLVYYAIFGAVLSALLVCLVVAGAFLGALLGVDLARSVAALFIAAMLAMIAALGLFLREVFLAVRSGTHNQP